MSKDFSGKVVIVTGSTSGIGEGIAVYLSKLGANIVVTGRREEEVKRVANLCESASPKHLKALEIVADITVDEDAKRLIDNTVAQFGKIDILVNNAAAIWFTNIFDDKLMENYENIMRIDLRAVVYLSHLVVSHLEKTKGNIVNISSGAALKPANGMMPYCMAKAALDMFTKCLAIELGPKGVRVNAINSGLVETNMAAVAGMTADQIAYLNEIAKQSPIGRIGKPQDIANTVAFLASSEAQFITGTCMVVDGGLIYGNVSPKLD